MSKTSLDIVTAAYRRLGVASEDSPLSAEQNDIGSEALEALVAELDERENIPGVADVEAIPDIYFLPLVEMLSAQLAPNYGIQNPQNQWFDGMKRLRRHAFTNNQEPADTTLAGKRAAFY